MIRLLKYNLIVLIVFNVSAQNNLKVKRNLSKKNIVKALIVNNKTNKKKFNQIKILHFVERRFGANPAAAAIRPAISNGPRRF